MEEFLLTGQVKKTSDPSQTDIGSSEANTVAIQNVMVDKLTMEYMMNRSHYKKYLAKTDTNRFQETQEMIQQVREMHESIVQVVDELLTDFIQHGNFTKHNTQVNRSFETFLKECIRYIQDRPTDTDEFVDVMFSEAKLITSPKSKPKRGSFHPIFR